MKNNTWFWEAIKFAVSIAFFTRYFRGSSGTAGSCTYSEYYRTAGCTTVLRTVLRQDTVILFCN